MYGCLASVFCFEREREAIIAQKYDRKPRIRVNRMIRIPEVRVIDEEGEQLGVMATEQALALAEEKGLDLVEVSPTARPPVCRIMDFGKYKYEQSKKQKESKKKQHTVQVKEVKFRPKTEEHDYQFKKRHAEEFLEKGHKVKITMMFRGRELDHRDLGMKMLTRLEEELSEVGAVERPAKHEGRLIVMYMAPLAGRTKRKAEEKESQQPELSERRQQASQSADSESSAQNHAGEQSDAGKQDAQGESEQPEQATADEEGKNAETQDQ